MKTEKFVLSTIVALATLAITATAAQAVSLVNQALEVLPAPPSGEPVFTFTELRATSLPFFSPILRTGSGPALRINNNLNNLDVSVGDIVYRLLSPDAQFGTVTSNLYTVTLSENNSVATFTGARVNPGEVFRIERTVSDGSPVDFTLKLSTANETNTPAVPEPNTIAGLALAGVACAYIRRRKQQAQPRF
ncbi:PEP-CTERM sorting domain-containing protein [Nostoc sp. LPT]|uniref:PEP-CTERM sorting domain-containing protein n=1 Tax=Nostoc sp. LPT TaxID=2815387 RepID=UPI001D8AA63D|nr:PEP-CTERM sorting domain-containing protein [Nostoc sp. LPT]MBN4003060.1 PEP-CTERM sorting domain-containing protein [Nostoc sp. LPT]